MAECGPCPPSRHGSVGASSRKRFRSRSAARFSDLRTAMGCTSCPRTRCRCMGMSTTGRKQEQDSTARPNLREHVDSRSACMARAYWQHPGVATCHRGPHVFGPLHVPVSPQRARRASAQASGASQRSRPSVASHVRLSLRCRGPPHRSQAGSCSLSLSLSVSLPLEHSPRLSPPRPLSMSVSLNVPTVLRVRSVSTSMPAGGEGARATPPAGHLAARRAARRVQGLGMTPA
jgi:hypothetical protein